MAERYMPLQTYTTSCMHLLGYPCSSYSMHVNNCNMLRCRVVEFSLYQYEYNKHNRNGFMNTIKVSHNRNLRSVSVPENIPHLGATIFPNHVTMIHGKCAVGDMFSGKDTGPAHPQPALRSGRQTKLYKQPIKQLGPYSHNSSFDTTLLWKLAGRDNNRPFLIPLLKRYKEQVTEKHYTVSL